MATSLLANGVQFPDNSVQTSASTGSGVSSLQTSSYSTAFPWGGGNNPSATPITLANEYSSSLNLPSFTYDFNNMIYVGYQYYANALTFTPGPRDIGNAGIDRPAPAIPIPGQVFYRILYRTA